MNKQKFNSLDLMKQLEYVNKKLSDGESLREISKGLNMSKTTIRNRFKKIDYVFNKDKKQYIKDNENVEDEYKHNTNVLVHEEKQGEYEHNTNILDAVLDKEHIKEKLVNIIDSYDNIQAMLKWFENQKNIVEVQEINIDTDKLIGDVKTTTVRLYSKVWDDFRKFMKDYPEYKSMDLVSMALVEYMNKYKK
ncbi:hypothetical protein [Clostridium cochlearium]|uniref:hypothetical protein n=1 Tax=Clostridium cochlearium TaxID=1494 RepID=UPI00156E3593|nr:hypothetical protein [Clostridium cochlearium]MBV1820499.1 hypothetical protein [Bacteroidales bacterium MSK.15.36]MCG4572770.1 hypothetical protein [Clostridium cochlearium]MCG4580699.1 hypothetical protein [Clostridium cochlearium]NSJ92396.1 DUF4250 domain-containing protein [Coprococcus sp. MSK.21.13]